jgi:hypothetical protein
MRKEKMEIDFSKVTKVYMGKDAHCRCGCGGEYVYRGQPFFEKRLARFAKKLSDYTPSKFDVDSTYANVSYGNNRALTVYFD